MKRFSFVMALLITLTSLPLSFAVGVSAADNEAVIVETDQQYATLEEAINAVENAQTIKLLKNVDIASGAGIIINAKKNITIEGNGLTVSATLSGVPKYDFARTPDAVVIELGINDYVNGGLSNDPATYAAGVKKFIGDLRSKYGEDVPIVWLYGYRDDAQDFWATTKATLDEIIAAGDTNIYYGKVSKAYLTSAQGGDNYHPNVKMAQTFGQEVADLLKAIIK